MSRRFNGMTVEWHGSRGSGRTIGLGADPIRANFGGTPGRPVRKGLSALVVSTRVCAAER